MNDIEYTGFQRDPREKFYTKDEVVQLCYKELRKQKIVNKGDLMIEPSAGKGAFNKYIKRLTNNYRFYDIEPAHKDVVQQDFLTLQLEPDIDTTLHFFGNPPFGRQSSLARKFIKQCCMMNAQSISFILPRSFRKPSFQTAFDRSYHLVCDIDIPSKAFIVNNEDHDVPCVFQIWQKKGVPRDIEQRILPQHYRFVKHNENPDVSVRRVGVYAGKADADCTKSPQSHYFIEFEENIDVPIILEYMKKMTFEDSNNTVGPKSISKPELIKKINEIIENIYS